MKCLRREKGKKKRTNIDGVEAMLCWSKVREKQQEELAREVTLGVKGGFTVVFGEVCISYLIPFQSPEVREINELFKLTES